MIFSLTKFTSTKSQLVDNEVANLPDIVESPDENIKSDRLERMVKRRREKHGQIWSGFKRELGAEMSAFHDKIEELLLALRSKLNLNR